MGSKMYLIGMLKVENEASVAAEIFRKITAENVPDLLRAAANPA